MKTIIMLLMIGLLLSAQQQSPDPFANILAEPNPEKRYAKALDLAAAEVTAARKKYENGRLEDFRASLILVEKSVRFADETLRGTGKNPAKSPKHFKRAEQKIRDIMRKLLGLEDAVSVDDRTPVRKTHDALQQIQEDIVMDIVGRRR